MASLSIKLIEAYNETRGEEADRTVLCHAPFTSMNFEQTGKANACCYNRTHVLGKYPRDSLEQMWFGAAAEQLRGYLRQDSLEGGCSMCKRQLESGNLAGCKARIYDQYAQERPERATRVLTSLSPARAVAMPRVMEFELENTCNLQCIMCDGYFSSAIRRHREKQPPQIRPYDAGFVTQLAEFMPHLEEMKFLGGEPFMIGIYYDIWEEVARVNPGVKIRITTNATTLNDRTKTLLEKMSGTGVEVTFCVSIDSVRKETYEAIRVGASYEQVMENVTWLSEYLEKRNASLGFAVCPMADNRFEMPDLVRFASEKGIVVTYNTVVKPPEQALRFLNHQDLDELVTYYESGLPAHNSPIGKINLDYFTGYVNQVKAWRDETAKPAFEKFAKARRIDPSSRPQESALTRKILLASIIGAGGKRDRLPPDPELDGVTPENFRGYLWAKLSETTPDRFWDAYLACFDWVASECLLPAEYRDYRRKAAAIQGIAARLVGSAKLAILSELLKGDVIGHLRFMLAMDLADIEGELGRYEKATVPQC
jgi:MoaA/NifB/PqqE/SkfB family radical SAM enzyme